MAHLVDQLRLVYSGKKVLVTGHNGFKGTWLVALLNHLGADVVGISLEIDSQSPFKEFHQEGPHTSITQDIREYLQLKRFISDIDPDLVFHLAAQPLVLESYKFPRETFETNVQGTANLLDALSGTKYLGAVVATTDKVYLNIESGREFEEDDQLWGHDPYSLSKTGTELVVQAWRNNPMFSSKNFVTVRAGNVFGPGDRGAQRLVPDILRSIYSSDILEIRSPNAVRPWQYVLDPLYGYLIVGMNLLLGHKLQPSYNFGPNDHSFLTVLELVQRINSMLTFQYRITNSSDHLESGILRLNSQRARQELSWNYFTDVDSGLKKLIEIDSSIIRMPVIQYHVEEYFSRIAVFESGT